MLDRIKVTIFSYIVILFFIIACEKGPTIEKKIPAFYYPRRRSSGLTGAWKRWGIEGHNPDTFVSPGRRDIASVNNPKLGPYDSLDPDVIDLHIQQSVDAGIDAWIISWWGVEEEIRLIPARIAALKSPLKITAYYEHIPGCIGLFCREKSIFAKVTDYF